MKITVKNTGTKYKILINEDDITNKIANMKIDMQPLELPKITMELAVTEQDIVHEQANLFVKINNKIYRIMEEKQ